jgi:hypothetical protein
VNIRGTALLIAFTTPAARAHYAALMQPHDEPLPATFAFVLTLGGLIAVGWCLMFFLMRAEW